MSEIDWSKPIEVYDPYNQNEPPDPAEVVEVGLRGGHPIGIKWITPSEDLLMNVDESGCIRGEVWAVRNKPVVHRKYVCLSVTKAGGLVIESFETKEDADHHQAYRMRTGTYVVSDVVELEWTEE